MKNKTVAIGMSGGVDSSVAAYLLKKQGYRVFGLFMKNWEDLDGSCPAENDVDDVALVCNKLDIPYYTINFTNDYQDRVFQDFLKGIEQGFTPNPDILCNKEIKFDILLKKAFELGADYLATGHYAKTENGELIRGIDINKDQTYFLYTLKKNILEKVLFPIGNLEKPKVREIARELGLQTADKKDSTGICFIGKRKFKDFIKGYIPEKNGVFINLDGKVLGEHQGACYYTIGQRKGLGIGGPGEAYFVAAKDIKNNTVTVVQGQDHKALFTKTLSAIEPSWVDEEPVFPLHCSAKIRYRQKDSECIVEKNIENGKLLITFLSPQRAVTPMQSIVFYQNEICLGGAFIKEAVSSPSFLETEFKATTH